MNIVLIKASLVIAKFIVKNLGVEGSTKNVFEFLPEFGNLLLDGQERRKGSFEARLEEIGRQGADSVLEVLRNDGTSLEAGELFTVRDALKFAIGEVNSGLLIECGLEREKLRDRLMRLDRVKAAMNDLSDAGCNLLRRSVDRCCGEITKIASKADGFVEESTERNLRLLDLILDAMRENAAQTRELRLAGKVPIADDLLVLLRKNQELCATHNVPFRSAHLLLSIFEVRGVAYKALYDMDNSTAIEITKWLREEVNGPLGQREREPYHSFVFEERDDVRRAMVLATEDRWPVVTDKHLAISVFVTDPPPVTVRIIQDGLGAILFPKFLRSLQNSGPRLPPPKCGTPVGPLPGSPSELSIPDSLK